MNFLALCLQRGAPPPMSIQCSLTQPYQDQKTISESVCQVPRKVRGGVYFWGAQYLRREADVNVLVPYKAKVNAWWGPKRNGSCCLGSLSRRWHLSWELREDTFPGRWRREKGLVKGPGQARTKQLVLLGRWLRRITAQRAIEKRSWAGETSETSNQEGSWCWLGDSERDPTGTGASEALDLVQVGELVNERLVRRYIQWV